MYFILLWKGEDERYSCAQIELPTCVYRLEGGEPKLYLVSGIFTVGPAPLIPVHAPCTALAWAPGGLGINVLGPPGPFES